MLSRASPQDQMASTEAPPPRIAWVKDSTASRYRPSATSPSPRWYAPWAQTPEAARIR